MATRYGLKVRRLEVYTLAAGILVSLTVFIVFYHLATSLPRPVLALPGITQPSAYWIAFYTNWYDTHVFYSLAYGLGIVAAIELTVILGVLLAPRLALLASVSLINIYFAWTAHVISSVSQHVSLAIGNLIVMQDNFFWANAGLGFFTASSIVVTDLEALILLGGIFALAITLNRGKGARKAVLLGLQITALSLSVYGLEIALFDHNELALHVTQSQILFKLAPSFSNADLLYSALAVLAASSCLLHSGGLRALRYRSRTRLANT